MAACLGMNILVDKTQSIHRSRGFEFESADMEDIVQSDMSYLEKNYVFI